MQRVRTAPIARRLALTVASAGIALALCTSALVVTVGQVGREPLYRDAGLHLGALPQVSTVYAADGSSLGMLGVEDREPVTYREIPKVLVDAVVATEDRSFWSNPGIDVRGMTRALVADVEAGRVEQGGSTITEQLVKERLLDPKHDAAQKLDEIALAVRAAHKLSKREVVTEYLNAVYFGEGAYGVKAAARRFFAPGKPLDQLTLPDAALLAGLIASPSGYDPFAHPDAARLRRMFVLDQMVSSGATTRAQADEAGATPLPSVPVPGALAPQSAVVDEIEQLLLADSRLGSTPRARRARILQGGLKIYTTIDPVAQARALDAIQSVVPGQDPFTAALVSIDPNTGYVRAAATGLDFAQLQYDIVTHPPGRQPGSTYKVITLAAALEAGYSPNDTVDGTSPCTASRPGIPVWHTENAEPGGGVITLRDATVDSVNCAYAHVIASVGPAAVIDMAHRLGITQDLPEYLPITLGVKEATPLEMATVAATLAAGGVRHDPTFIERVVTAGGATLIDNSHPVGRRVVAEDVVDCETDVLRGVIARGTGTQAALDGARDAAGKTGTTDDHGDAWFLGFTPQLATVVWMGAPDSRVPMTDVGGIEVFGGTYPARVWKAFMDAELADQPALDLPDSGSVCGRPGASITDAGRGDPAELAHGLQSAPSSPNSPDSFPAPIAAPDAPPSVSTPSTVTTSPPVTTFPPVTTSLPASPPPAPPPPAPPPPVTTSPREPASSAMP